jgi:four helix bundle protein
MNNFRELVVWQKSIVFVSSIYQITKSFPSDERNNLVNQVQRSAVSIPSNIAEGAGRNSNNLFKQFLSIALGSSYELETQIIISKNLGYVSESVLNGLLQELTAIQKMIYGLYNTL